MSRVHAGICPALEDLLLAEEGELPPQAQAAVAAHLGRCVACQSALSAVAGILRMVGHVTNQFGEGRDTGSTDAAEARFQRFRVLLHARKQQRIHTPAGWPVRRWLAFAAVPLLIAGFIVFEPHTAVIEADELVKFAASAEAARPAGTMQQRVSIKLTRSNNFAMSNVGAPAYVTERMLTDGIITSSASVPLEGMPATIAKLLADHRFRWSQPLSARDFHAWRGTLAHKHDEVIAPRGSALIRLRTTTDDDGDLHEVELTIERDTYRIIRQSFVFETAGTLEIDESAQWVRRVPPTPAPAATALVGASASAVTRPTRPTPERIDSLPTKPAAPQPDLARWLDRRFGNTATRTEFMPELRRLTSAIRQRLDSLQDLSSRYPGSDGPQASPSARARLQRELELQYPKLREDLDALYPRITALTLPSDEVPRRPLTKHAGAPADWARRVDTARPEAFKLDRLASELRAYDDLPAPVRQRLVSSFDKLWAAIYAVAP